MTEPNLDDVVKVSHYLPVSAEVLADGGYLVPLQFGPISRAEQAEAQRRRDDRDAELRTQVDAQHADSRARLDGQLLEVADLHGPVVGSAPWPVCEGCDGDGWESEPPKWPCRTYALVTGDAARAA